MLDATLRGGWALEPSTTAGEAGPEAGGGPAEPGLPTRRDRRSVARPPVFSVPGPLRHVRVRTTRRTVLALAAVTLAALVLFGVRVWLAQAAASPQPVPGAVATSGEGTPSGLVARSVPPAFAPRTSAASTTKEQLVVHVVGSIAHPGIVRVPPGSRVIDAITAAGGPTTHADLSRVNLARLVVDGEQIAVPRPGEVVTGPLGATPSGAAGARVDLNAADLAALDALPGVGPVLAQRILDWRADHGRFSTVDELAEVSGIGDKLLAQLRPKVQV
ncbi:MAG TPA: helix-hairpin-helix domain-containing protein [Candidatus Lustribacter sp.]|nr:helix-hairpin-helix domain-containing protein [Candidatus Lustribacter sp.]